MPARTENMNTLSLRFYIGVFYGGAFAIGLNSIITLIALLFGGQS
jgi:hypothetical protein